MSVSLETRVPFLDKDVVEFAGGVARPEGEKGRRQMDGAASAGSLRSRPLIDRPKSGFGVPLDDWLRGPLKPWASDLLAP